MLSVLFPQELLSRDARHSVSSSTFFIGIGCYLHNIKHLSFLDNNSSTESILEEKCI